MRLFLIIIPVIIILNSCSTTKHVPKNKHLLIRNNIEVIKGEKIALIDTSHKKFKQNWISTP